MSTEAETKTELNSFVTFTPTEKSTHLHSKQECNHYLLATFVCKQLTGHYLHEINKDTTPTPGSIAYKTLLSEEKRLKGYTTWKYALPKKDEKDNGGQDPYFNGVPVVYLIRGPTSFNKFGKSATETRHGLDYFRDRGIKPTIEYLNDVFMPLGMKVMDCSAKDKGFLMLIFDSESFVVKPREPREPREHRETRETHE